jgi:hypothetical protein
MTPLNGQQKQLLFDYSLGMTSERDSAEAERLLATHEEAAGIHSALKQALAPLDTLEVGPCPDELADVTVSLLKAEAQTLAQALPASDRLETLLAAESVSAPAVIRLPFWRNWGDLAAVAAVMVLFAGVVIPALGMARQKYYQTRCQANLGDIHGGLTRYVSDNDGRLPNVAATPGAPWWKVGYQGAENQSNTRGAWLLVKQGYVPLDAFSCPGRRDDRARGNTAQIQKLNDFPSRASMHFSMRVCCSEVGKKGLNQRIEIFADRNPISEEFPSDYSKPFLGLRLSPELLTINSRNHRGRGQNALFSDGSVEFTRKRHTRASKDDMYTLAEMSDGCKVSGCEVPSCEKDAFMAP